MRTSNDFTDVFVTPCWLWAAELIGKKINIILKIFHIYFEELETQNACDNSALEQAAIN